jgi:urea transport system substrate-binding protein
MNRMSRRQVLKSGATGLAGITVGGGLLAACGEGGGSGSGGGGEESGPIKVGLLSSLSGGLSIIEESIYRSGQLAIEEINAAGGINGRKIVPVVADYASDFSIAVQKAEQLVTRDKVAATFGCYTSASRVSVLPVFERNKAMLFYGTLYEGLECSPNCVYTGCIPTQQLFDFCPWIVETLGKKVYIVGSDYIYPRTMSAIEQILIKEAGGTIVSDRYFPLGTTEFAPVIASFRETKPDVILSNMVGDSTPAFYKQFKAAGFNAESLPIAATVTTEQEVQAMGADAAEGHYMSISYFQSLDNPANKKFVAAFKKKYGEDQVTNQPMAGNYMAVKLWAEAVKKSGSTSFEALHDTIVGTEYTDSPEGVPVKIQANRHVTLPSLISQANAQGQYDVVKNFGLRPPDPFPGQIVPKNRIPQCPAPLSQTQKG